MKILHVLDHSIPLHSGYTFRTRSILEQQRAMGWETDHITSSKHYGAEALEEDIDGLHFFRTPNREGLFSRMPILNQWDVVDSLKRRLREVVQRVRPDVLHAHSPALNGLAALSVAREFGLPLVYEVRAFWEDAAVDHGTSREWGLRYRATRAMESYVLRNADAITTICHGLRDEIISRGITASKVTVIANAVNVDSFTPSGHRDAVLEDTLGLQDCRTIGFIGSFYAYEGLELLVRAMRKITESAPDVRLLLVGGGPEEKRLKAIIAKMGLAGKVIMPGRVPHADVQRYYDCIDACVYPRTSMRLTELVTPLKPLEAMAQGRLVIASDVGGHKELINDGQNGLLFKANDASDLAATVLSALSDPVGQALIKATARGYVETERNWPVCVAPYSDVYESLSKPKVAA